MLDTNDGVQKGGYLLVVVEKGGEVELLVFRGFVKRAVPNHPVGVGQVVAVVYLYVLSHLEKVKYHQHVANHMHVVKCAGKVNHLAVAGQVMAEVVQEVKVVEKKKRS